ncbi:MAG: DUF1385 domain-containing protein [Thermoleophilia bacterium]
MNLGGMALRDGVLLQGERHWVAAVRRPDGVHVASGERARLPGTAATSQVPVIRGLIKLGEALAVLPAVRRATGGPVLPQEEPRLLVATALSAAGTFVVRHRMSGSPFVREMAAMGISLAPVFLLLRDSRLARYHGAEHKSIAAYEGDTDAATADKEHARCGTNLIAPIAVTTVASNMLLRAAGKEDRPLATFVAGMVSIGTAVELFSWMGRHKDHPLARTLRRPGIMIQRLFTTSEPDSDQLDVADIALRELLRLEGLAPAHEEAQPTTGA